MGPRGRSEYLRVGTVVLLAAIMVSPIGILGISATPSTSPSSMGRAPAQSPPAADLAAIDRAPLADLTDTEPGVGIPGAVAIGPIDAASLHILIGFDWSNESALGTYLTALSQPTSPTYHQYLSREEFDSEYGAPASVYEEATAFFGSFDVQNLTTFADRGTLVFDATPAVAAEIFHVQLNEYRSGSIQYYAPTSSTLELPSLLTGAIATVEGLSSYSQFVTHTDLVPGAPIHAPPPPTLPVPSTYAGGGYYPPPTVDGVQYEYAPDFQVAYDELSLFQQYGYATDQVVATILWAGETSGGTPVAPWNPTDIYDYYNETLPAGQPHATVVGNPLDGAPAPGPSAGSDVTGATDENTLDLEMAGATAPGATIDNVYGPNSEDSYLAQALSTILNAPASSPLRRVTVISNSWTSTDINDTAWYNALQESQALGITILASSGDSGDNPSSSKWTGSDVGFPGTMAFNTYGVTSVGGTSVVLDPQSLHVVNDSAWYTPSGPQGSAGGISRTFPEPSWQLSSLANRVIGGAGVGVPDVAAIAQNMLITITIAGFQYRATNASLGGTFDSTWGTSISSPLLAGILAEINHTLAASSTLPLGYLNPTIYRLADLQFAPAPSSGNIGVVLTGPYNSTLPTLPFMDIVQGSNFVYPALYEYDLVTGWGSIDAYNFTMYVLPASSTGVYGRLSGVEDDLDLNALAVNSVGPHVAYNASIQQNFFLANSLGAPVYWIQNVIYIIGAPGAWQMTYSGWTVYPFFGQYPDLSVYEFNYPPGQTVSLPATFDMTSQLVSTPGFNAENVTFSVGASTLELPVPGAAYIIGSLWYNYSWQGTTYENGPFPDTAVPGGLSPQFGVVGGPSGGLGHFATPTSGTLTTSVQPYGTPGFVASASRTFGLNIDQTGEQAANVAWTYSGGAWALGISPGSTTQGVLFYEAPTGATYGVTLAETGLPTGTTWFVNSTDSAWTPQSATVSAGGGTTITIPLADGSYSATIATSNPAWEPTSQNRTWVVDGANLTVTTPFVALYSVDVTESGLPAGTLWFVNVTTAPVSEATWAEAPRGIDRSYSSTSASIGFSLPNGSYAYTIASVDPAWSPESPSNDLTVSGRSVSEDAPFVETYHVTFEENGLPLGTEWYVNVSGSPSMSTTTSSLIVELPNGTYSYRVQSTDKRFATAENGTVTVDSATVEVLVYFSLYTSYVPFEEVGLPSGTEWYVNVTGAASASSTQPQLLIPLANGTHTYEAASADKEWGPSPANGTFTLQGAPLVQQIQFVAREYALSFAQTGLPAGATWQVTVAGIGNMSSTGASLTFQVDNGTYPYRVGVSTTSFDADPAYGVVAIAGNGTAVSIAIDPVLYPVIAGSTGLPTGNVWYVNLTGGASYQTSGRSLGMLLQNGTYAYSTTTSNPLYAPVHGSGTFQVVGGAANFTVAFAAVGPTPPHRWAVNFVETGLPLGTAWTVTVVAVSNGTTTTAGSTTMTVTFLLTNGSYTYRVTTVAAYTPTPASGGIGLSGPPSSTAVTFNATSSGGSSRLVGSTTLAVIGIVTVVIVVIAVVLLLRRRR